MYFSWNWPQATAIRRRRSNLQKRRPVFIDLFWHFEHLGQSKFFCTTDSPLAGTRWVWSTFSSHFPLYYAVSSINMATFMIFWEKILGMLGFKPGDTGFEVQALCYADPLVSPQWYFLLLALQGTTINFKISSEIPIIILNVQHYEKKIFWSIFRLWSLKWLLPVAQSRNPYNHNFWCPLLIV